MKAREGDLIKNTSNVIFDVKGLVHPSGKVIAFPRYIPSPKGARAQLGNDANLYCKVYNLAERFQYLRQNAPELIVFDPVFGETLCEVPVGQIAKHYKPIEKLAELRESEKLASLEAKSVLLTKLLEIASRISWRSIGVSGSIMAGLFTLKSDIDVLVYGVGNCWKIYAALEKMLKDESSRFKPYSREELLSLFEFRSKDTKMSFEDFERVESRKAFQGKFDGVDYFVRFVKNWNEVDEKYGDVLYSNSGYSRIVATVCDDSEALFTPCTYKVESVKVINGPKTEPISEVVSFRGRFCEQAKAGEEIEVQGKVEHLTNKRKGEEHYRLIIGNQPSDYMVLL